MTFGQSWSDVSKEFRRGAILLGNGASRAVWEGFNYKSLFEQAAKGRPTPILSPEDIRLFEELGTTSFESLLNSLQVAESVSRALSTDTSEVKRRYESIRRALIRAVHRVHVPWKLIGTDRPRLRLIRQALQKHDYVFSTNYDLIVYWSIMDDPYGSGFIDYFYKGSFDPRRYDSNGATRVLYLHGGLHLEQLPSKEVKKRTCGFQNLLEQFGQPTRVGAVPLFVGEGSHLDKLRSIRSSPYLNFALDQLKDYTGPVVVFGHSLQVHQDGHLIEAIGCTNGRQVAISIRADDEESFVRQSAEYTSRLSGSKLSFFAASSHPLGAAALAVAPTPTPSAASRKAVR